MNLLRIFLQIVYLWIRKFVSITKMYREILDVEKNDFDSVGDFCELTILKFQENSELFSAYISDNKITYAYRSNS